MFFLLILPSGVVITIEEFQNIFTALNNTPLGMYSYSLIQSQSPPGSQPLDNPKSASMNLPFLAISYKGNHTIYL